MEKNKDQNWKNILQTVICVFLPFLMGLITMNTASSLDNALLISLASECSKADNSKAYLEYTIDSKNTGESNAMNFFTRNYSKNFDGQTSQLVCASQEGSLLRYCLSFDGIKLSEKIALATVNTYSNQNKRFESICIELLKDRPRSEELAYPSWGGGVALIWLPDYFGDLIIHSDKSYSTYDDILNADVPCILPLSDGSERIFKIVNFFHVNGFSEAYALKDEYYKESDYHFGTMLNYYLHDFVFTTDNSLASSPSKSIVAMTGTKRFDFSGYLDSISAYYGTNNISIKYAKVLNGEVSVINGYDDLISYHSDKNSAVQIVAYVVYALVLLLEIISVLVYFKKRKRMNERSTIFFIGDLLILVTVAGIIQLTRVIIGNRSLIFLEIFSGFFGAALLVEILLLLVILGRSLYERKK